MQHNEALKLQKELREDFERSDAAVMGSLRVQVKEFLFEEASRLSGKIVRDEAKIKELIRVHAYVQILKILIENPKSFGPKELKEILKSGEAENANLPAVIDPFSAISALKIPDSQKAQMMETLTGMAAAEAKVRRELQEARAREA